MGLRRGFMLAGARNLLITLWPVTTKGAGDFMLDFYSAVHQSGNAPETLARVQRDWLAKTRKEQGLLLAVYLAVDLFLIRRAVGRRSSAGRVGVPAREDERPAVLRQAAAAGDRARKGCRPGQ